MTSKPLCIWQDAHTHKDHVVPRGDVFRTHLAAPPHDSVAGQSVHHVEARENDELKHDELTRGWPVAVQQQQQQQQRQQQQQQQQQQALVAARLTNSKVSEAEAHKHLCAIIRQQEQRIQHQQVQSLSRTTLNPHYISILQTPLALRVSMCSAKLLWHVYSYKHFFYKCIPVYITVR